MPTCGSHCSVQIATEAPDPLYKSTGRYDYSHMTHPLAKAKTEPTLVLQLDTLTASEFEEYFLGPATCQTMQPQQQRQQPQQPQSQHQQSQQQPQPKTEQVVEPGPPPPPPPPPSRRQSHIHPQLPSQQGLPTHQQPQHNPLQTPSGLAPQSLPPQAPSHLTIQTQPHPRSFQRHALEDRRRDVYVLDPTMQQHPQHGGFIGMPQVPAGLGPGPQGLPLPGSELPQLQTPMTMMLNPSIHHTAPPMPMGRTPMMQGTLPPMPAIQFDGLPLPPASAETEGPNRTPPPEPTLTLLPEDQRAIGHGARRPFQPRRRSRACDACRTRKTKCDTPDNGPCASCVAASLVCKFSDGGDERRRAGPTRKARELENENRMLKERNKEYRNKCWELLGILGMQPAQPNADPRFVQVPLHIQTMVASGQYPPNLMPPAGVPSGIPSGRDFAPMGMGQMPMGMAEEGLPEQFQRRQSTATSESSDMTIRGPPGDGQWNGQFYGSTSVPTFAMWYRGYMEYLGYNPPSNRNFTQEIPEMYAKPIRGTENEYQFPMLSDYPALTFRPGPTYDLRGFLPDKETADRLKQAFKDTVQLHSPSLHWLKLEARWQRAWSEPLWETDRTAVREVFCIVMMVLAVSSQFVRSMDVMDPNGGQRAMRNGWKNFELARKYHGLNNPVYTVGDAIITMLMSLYLDNASLPSPEWMMVGAMARICQDIGLHRSHVTHSPQERESRKRLFWGAYILDQKLALVLGRPGVFRNSQIEVGLPEIIEDDDSVGFSADSEEGGMKNARAIRIFRANIIICQQFEDITNLDLVAGGSHEDLQNIYTIDRRLTQGWDEFPQDMTDHRNDGPLDIPLLRPLINIQHARLSLYRWFCDFSRNLQPSFRKQCLFKSVQVARITAHLLLRATQSPNFDEDFALRTNDLVHIHAFRAAAVLLLQFSVREPAMPPVTQNELGVCVRALKAAAARHPAAARYADLYDSFARTFQYSSSSPSSRSASSPAQPGEEYQQSQNIPLSSTGLPLTPSGSLFSGSGGGNQGTTTNPSTPTHGTEQQTTTSEGTAPPVAEGIDWSTLRDMMELDAGFGSMMSSNPLQPSSAAPTAHDEMIVNAAAAAAGEGTMLPRQQVGQPSAIQGQGPTPGQGWEGM